MGGPNNFLIKDNFSKCSKSKTGLQSVCKTCKNKKLTDFSKSKNEDQIITFLNDLVFSSIEK